MITEAHIAATLKNALSSCAICCTASKTAGDEEIHHAYDSLHSR